MLIPVFALGRAQVGLILCSTKLFLFIVLISYVIYCALGKFYFIILFSLIFFLLLCYSQSSPEKLSSYFRQEDGNSFHFDVSFFSGSTPYHTKYRFLSSLDAVSLNEWTLVYRSYASSSMSIGSV